METVLSRLPQAAGSSTIDLCCCNYFGSISKILFGTPCRVTLDLLMVQPERQILCFFV